MNIEALKRFNDDMDRAIIEYLVIYLENDMRDEARRRLAKQGASPSQQEDRMREYDPIIKSLSWSAALTIISRDWLGEVAIRKIEHEIAFILAEILAGE